MGVPREAARPEQWFSLVPGRLIAGTPRLRDPVLRASNDRRCQEYLSAEATMSAGEKQGTTRIPRALSSVRLLLLPGSQQNSLLSSP